MVLTGAGISTDSGIPDFRGPNGVWTRNPGAERRATLQNYMSDPEVRREAWRDAAGPPGTVGPSPTPATGRWSSSSARGKLDTLVTQNIDGLHQAAGLRSGHGRRGARHHAQRRVHVVRRAGAHGAGARPGAGRRGRSALPYAVAASSSRRPSASARTSWPRTCSGPMEAARRCDLLLAVGSTLAVYPVADMVPVARMAGAQIVIVNAEETAMDDLADAVIRGAIGEVLPALGRHRRGRAERHSDRSAQPLHPSGTSRSPDVSSVSPMAALLEAARRRNPLPTGTLAVGAGLLVAGLSAYGFLAVADRPLTKAEYSPLSATWSLVFLARPGPVPPAGAGDQPRARRAPHPRGGRDAGGAPGGHPGRGAGSGSDGAADRHRPLVGRRAVRPPAPAAGGPGAGRCRRTGRAPHPGLHVGHRATSRATAPTSGPTGSSGCWVVCCAR